MESRNCSKVTAVRRSSFIVRRSTNRSERASLTPTESSEGSTSSQEDVLGSQRLLSFRQCSSDTLGIGLGATLRIQSMENLTRASAFRCEIARISIEDFEVGPLISRGSFSQVRRVRLLDSEDSQSYALKELKHHVKNHKDLLVPAAIALGLEAQILSQIKHPHVTTLLAVPSGQLCRLLKSGNLFLLLDFIDETLDRRIERWRCEQTLFRNKQRSRLRIAERLEMVALGIANAMEHCHSLNIIHRDIKPRNIGFDAESGIVKIIDFSLGRECIDEEENSKLKGSDYKMTGNVGTPRYMSPEVALERHYGFPADVYSFNIMLWELVTLRRPFHHLSNIRQFQREVALGGVRPPLEGFESTRLKNLLGRGWSRADWKRPCFESLVISLGHCICDLRDGEHSPKLVPAFSSHYKKDPKLQADLQSKLSSSAPFQTEKEMTKNKHLKRESIKKKQRNFSLCQDFDEDDVLQLEPVDFLAASIVDTETPGLTWGKTSLDRSSSRESGLNGNAVEGQ